MTKRCGCWILVLFMTSWTQAQTSSWRDQVGHVLYMPYFGVKITLSEQLDVLKDWQVRWNGYVPGTTWTGPDRVGSVLARGDKFSQWEAAERLFVRTGSFPESLARDLCKEFGSTAILQGAMSGDLPASSQIQSPSGTPVPNIQRSSSGGRAFLTLSLFSCDGGSPIWSSTRHVDFYLNYTVAQLAKYAQKAMEADLDRK